MLYKDSGTWCFSWWIACVLINY